MRVALLSYRSKPHVGGQGIYVRRLSAALAAAGHDVTVFSGQPYPADLAEGVRLEKLPSLDLYNDEAPFTTPPLSQWRDLTDATEVLDMWTAGFPEPRTFGERAYRALRHRIADFDVIHDNQSLGYGIGRLAARGAPVVATIHHPITHDLAVELQAATSLVQRLTLRRWYGFLRMQGSVARALPGIITVSQSSARDIRSDFRVHPKRLHVAPLGVDTGRFHPGATDQVPQRIVAVASADAPLKGVKYLIRALAIVRRRVPQAHLELVSSLDPTSPVSREIARLGLNDCVRTHSGLDEPDMAKLYASANVVAVPSLYEGFSLPTLEAMASGRPVIASEVGAIPEVLGTSGILVPKADVGALASALEGVLSDAALARRLGEAARARAEASFTWKAVATAHESTYRTILGA